MWNLLDRVLCSCVFLLNWLQEGWSLFCNSWVKHSCTWFKKNKQNNTEEEECETNYRCSTLWKLGWLQHSNAKYSVVIDFISFCGTIQRCWFVCFLLTSLSCVCGVVQIFTSAELTFNVQHCKFLTCLIYNMFIGSWLIKTNEKKIHFLIVHYAVPNATTR